jgi:hypothetical protein
MHGEDVEVWRNICRVVSEKYSVLLNADACSYDISKIDTPSCHEYVRAWLRFIEEYPSYAIRIITDAIMLRLKHLIDKNAEESAREFAESIARLAVNMIITLSKYDIASATQSAFFYLPNTKLFAHMCSNTGDTA